jgi:hypothetical protein
VALSRAFALQPFTSTTEAYAAKVAILLSLPLWIATALPAQRVQTSYDHGADFFGHETYTWMQMSVSHSLLDQRLKDMVISSLAAKGLTQVSSGGELGVFAAGTSETRQKLITLCNGSEGGWGRGQFWRRSVLQRDHSDQDLYRGHAHRRHI